MSASSSRPLRIAILTSGRFHVLDLARELALFGHEVTFYSLLPPWRLAERGFDARRGRWLGWTSFPLVLAQRARFAPSLVHVANTYLPQVVDRSAAQILRPCDVFIGMAGMCLRTIRAAHRLGAVAIVERSSQHIEAQLAILGRSISTANVRRELAEYAEADLVNLPAEHCRATFVERGFDTDRLAVNPFGVDLAEFPWTPAPEGPLRVIMVGTFSFQKAADVVVDAIRKVRESVRDIELLHVGAAGDVPFPFGEEGFRHVDPVPQRALSAYYAQAHIAVMASRQEGLAVVQVQALASGVPLVCSTHSGGDDLRASLDDPSGIAVVAPGDSKALARELLMMAERARGARGGRILFAEGARERFSWRRYAERYEATIQQVRNARGPRSGRHRRS